MRNKKKRLQALTPHLLFSLLLQDLNALFDAVFLKLLLFCVSREGRGKNEYDHQAQSE